MGVAPENFTPKIYHSVTSKQTMVNCTFNRKICLNISFGGSKIFLKGQEHASLTDEIETKRNINSQ